MSDALRPLLSESRTPDGTGFADIADTIGVAEALKLSEGWPGVRLFVPKVMTELHPIALKIGFQAALKLSKKYGGATLPIARNHRVLRARLRAEVVARFWAEESASKLAREYGLHEFTIYRWAGEAKNDRQSELFEGP